MAKLPTRYQEQRRFSLHWFRLKNGKVVSYRWFMDDVAEKLKHVPKGAVEIQDPFRKGAPLGGYCNNRQAYEGLAFV